MRVCFVSPYAYSLFNPNVRVTHGGAEMDLFYIGEALAKDVRFIVSFVVADFGQAKNEKYNNIHVLKSFRTDRKGLHKILYGIFGIAPKLITSLWRMNADVYVQEGAGLETAIVAFFCRLTRKKFVYRVASTIECNNQFIKKFPVIGRFFFWGLRRADAIVTEDQEEAILMQKHHGLHAQAIYDTTPLPDTDTILPVTERKLVLWVGRLVPMKKPELFIKLADTFPQEQFVLIAPSDPQQQKFANSIKHLANLKRNVQLIPGLPHHELDAYYRKAKLFINTSDYEGYPNTFIEAGKYAVPIISFCVNPDNLFLNQKFGECADGSQTRFEGIVGSWLKDLMLRDRVGQKFSLYVRETSDMEKNITAYKKLLTELYS